MTIKNVIVDGDKCVICDTKEDFNEFCEAGGWGDHIGFKMDTGVDYNSLLGKPFIVVHGRVYINN